MATTTIQCPNCGAPVQAAVQNVIDVSRNPALKNALLSGQLNSVTCSNCGVTSTVAAPLLYHDASKEMLISFVPMELGLPKDQQNRVVGDLMNQLTASIPKDQFRGYMFQPKPALTMQGLIDQILEADGITKEVRDAQRNTMKLVENLLKVGPDKLDEAIAEHDAEINQQFFQAALALTQRAAQEGQEDMVNALVMIQERAAELSSYGQQMAAVAEEREEVIREVAAQIQALGEDAEQSDLIDLALGYTDSDEHLQALVGLVRPALDYQFFETLTQRIGQAPADERSQLETLRDRLVELTQMIDQQSQLAVQNAVALLQAIASSENMDETIAENAALIDDTFMAVLSANIQEAEKRADIQSSSRLKQVYERVVDYVQQNMQPELRLVNALLGSQSDEEAMMILAEGIEQYGEGVVQLLDSVGHMLGQRGETELVQKIAFLREAAARQLNS